MKVSKYILVMTFLTVMLLLTTVCSAAEHPRIQIKGTVQYIVYEGTYGILGEDGKKYQPVKQLPREYRKEGLAVIVEAKLRKDIVAARMWGNAVEIMTITKAELFVSEEDRQAIKLLLQRLDAFNNKDLAKLRQVDIMARSLTEEQLSGWLSGYGHFLLHYVETVKVEPNTIAGFCLYSRQLTNGMAVSGNVQHSLMQFTLKKIDGKWLIAETAGYKMNEEVDADRYLSELKARSAVKFGTDDLAKWKG